jgi:hypothetical protein
MQLMASKFETFIVQYSTCLADAEARLTSCEQNMTNQIDRVSSRLETTIQKNTFVSTLENRFFLKKIILGFWYFTSAKIHDKDQSQHVFDMFFYVKKHAKFSRCGFVDIHQRQHSPGV